MSVTGKGITEHHLSRDEFGLLGMIDRRYFIESSTERFEEWHSSFDCSHSDWPVRVEVQARLAAVTLQALTSCFSADYDRRIRLLFTGASLGSIATYFHAARLRERGWLERCDIDISDLLADPLKMTKAGKFDLSIKAAESAGLLQLLSPDDYKKVLSRSEVWAADAIDLAHASDRTYDVVVAPYVHHHLNLLDKATACRELFRVTKTGGCALSAI